MKVKQLTAGRVVALGAALALAGSTVLVAPGVAHAAVACAGGQNWLGDVDGDDQPDVAVGVPAADDAQGAVDLHLTSAASARLDASDFGRAATDGAQLGHAVALGDLSFDGCEDVVAGAPGAPGGGYVAVALGGHEGVRAASGFVVENPGAPGDRFGAAVALARGYDGVTSLWVGAPGADVSGRVDAGAIYHYLLLEKPDSPDEFEVTQLKRLTTSSLGLGVGVQPGDRFGEVLTVDSYNDRLVVGVPRRDVDGVTDAGAVAFVSPATAYSSGTPDYDTQLVHQGSEKVEDKPEGGDRFGAAVAAHRGRVAVGVPGEDVAVKATKKQKRRLAAKLAGKSKKKQKKLRAKDLRKRTRAGRDVGAVQLFNHGLTGELITQGSRSSLGDVPGSRVRNNRFGSAVGLSTGQSCDGVESLLVGAPGLDVEVKGKKRKGKKRKVKVRVDAGAVIVLNQGRCDDELLVQGKGLSGKAQAGDALGATLSVVADRLNRSKRADDVVIGVPGQAVGAAKDAGAVTGYADRSALVAGGSGYGSVLGTVMGS